MAPEVLLTHRKPAIRPVQVAAELDEEEEVLPEQRSYSMQSNPERSDENYHNLLRLQAVPLRRGRGGAGNARAGSSSEDEENDSEDDDEEDEQRPYTENSSR